MIRIWTRGAEEEIRAAVDRIESGCRARLLDRGHLERMLAAVEQHPHGAAAAEGGGVPLGYKYRAGTTSLRLWWLTVGGRKLYAAAVDRAEAPRIPRGSGPWLRIKTGREGKIAAHAALFPARSKRWRSALCRARLRSAGIAFPPEELLKEVIDLRERHQLALVETQDGRRLLCAPSGAFRLPLQLFGEKPPRTAGAAFKLLTGEALPCVRRAGREEAEALLILAALR